MATINKPSYIYIYICIYIPPAPHTYIHTLHQLLKVDPAQFTLLNFSYSTFYLIFFFMLLPIFVTIMASRSFGLFEGQIVCIQRKFFKRKILKLSSPLRPQKTCSTARPDILTNICRRFESQIFAG